MGYMPVALQNVEAITQWLAAPPPLPAARLDILHAGMSGWEEVCGDATLADEWALNIVHPERRNRPTGDLPGGSER